MQFTFVHIVSLKLEKQTSKFDARIVYTRITVYDANVAKKRYDKW